MFSSTWFWLVLGLSALLGLVSALVASLETAFLALDAKGRKTLRGLNPQAAKHIEKLMEEGPLSHLTIQLGDSLFHVVLLSLCFLAWPELVLMAAPWPSWLVVAGFFGSVILFCEILPKVVALHYPAHVLARGWPVLMGIYRSFLPVAERLHRLGQWWPLARTPARPSAVHERLRAELMTLAEIAAEEKSLTPEEARVFREIIRLGPEPAAHCLTPRVDCFLLPDDLSRDEAALLLRTRRYQRVPVRGETPDDLVGVLDVSRFFLYPERPWTDLLEPPGFIPEALPALELLQNFLLGRRRLALLLDEYGGFEGLVTLSDLLEEILGEQGPHSGSGLYLEDIGQGRFLANGHTRLDDLGERLGGTWPESQADTLGGLLLERLGRVPRPGDVLELPPGWRATVRRASRKRIKEVLLEKMPAVSPGEGP